MATESRFRVNAFPIYISYAASAEFQPGQVVRVRSATQFVKILDPIENAVEQAVQELRGEYGV